MEGQEEPPAGQLENFSRGCIGRRDGWEWSE